MKSIWGATTTNRLVVCRSGESAQSKPGSPATAVSLPLAPSSSYCYTDQGCPLPSTLFTHFIGWNLYAMFELKNSVLNYLDSIIPCPFQCFVDLDLDLFEHDLVACKSLDNTQL